MCLMRPRLYLDICCFKRPFDDQSQLRIRREAEATVAILESIEAGAAELVRSPAHDFENERNPREDRRLATDAWLANATISAPQSLAAGKRATALVALGFGPLDALHLAYAELAEAHWYLTTDDRLTRRAAQHLATLAISVVDPVTYIATVARETS